MEIKSEFLKIGLLDKRIPLNQTLSVSCHITQSEKRNISDNLDINIENKMNQALVSEITKEFHSKILKEISLTNEEFLNVMNLSESDSINILHNYLHENGFDFIIVGSEIAMFAQDSVIFNFDPISNKVSNGMNNIIYKIGKLGNIDCYIDAYKKYNDKEITCGKKESFIYNYKIDTMSKVTDVTFDPRMLVDLRYNFILKEESFLNLHFVNEYNPRYIQVLRDKKIDEIL